MPSGKVCADPGGSKVTIMAGFALSVWPASDPAKQLPISTQPALKANLEIRLLDVIRFLQQPPLGSQEPAKIRLPGRIARHNYSTNVKFTSTCVTTSTGCPFNRVG